MIRILKAVYFYLFINIVKCVFFCHYYVKSNKIDYFLKIKYIDFIFI
jgi:hypothetical protein